MAGFANLCGARSVLVLLLLPGMSLVSVVVYMSAAPYSWRTASSASDAATCASGLGCSPLLLLSTGTSKAIALARAQNQRQGPFRALRGLFKHPRGAAVLLSLTAVLAAVAFMVAMIVLAYRHVLVQSQAPPSSSQSIQVVHPSSAVPFWIYIIAVAVLASLIGGAVCGVARCRRRSLQSPPGTWENFFDADGVLATSAARPREASIASAKQCIRYGSNLDRQTYRELWLRVLNVRDWSATPLQFEEASQRLSRRYREDPCDLQLDDESERQITCDVNRLGGRDGSATGRILRAFFKIHRRSGRLYLQGYHYLAYSCADLFSGADQEHLAFAVFEQLMLQFVPEVSAKLVHDLEKLSSEILQKHDRRYHARLMNVLHMPETGDPSVCDGLGSHVYLWLTNFLQSGSPDNLVPMLSFFLSFPSPGKAVVCMTAAMSLSLKHELVIPVGCHYILLPSFMSKGVWDWSDLCRKCSELYDLHAKSFELPISPAALQINQ